MSGSSELTALVLQGGGALGAYQGGAYEALAAAGHNPQWIAGISIGAINAAIIAGNPVEHRVARLRTFWERVSSRLTGIPPLTGSDARTLFGEASAAFAAAAGVPGFFAPRFPPAAMMPLGSVAALSLYDTRPLHDTLLELVDFDVLNAGDVRLSVGAVNVASGNFAYFDTANMVVGPEHIMASGALPPGFPPIEIDGQLYWDGGLVSNTPLQYVVDECDRGQDLCAFQVDLFSARGASPRSLWDVEQREKDIRFSSRTRLNTDVIRRTHTLRGAARRLYAKLPKALRDDPDALSLLDDDGEMAITIVHLIYRKATYETQSKDYEFSRLSVEDHWQSGGDDVRHSLRQPAWQHRKPSHQGVAIFDLTRDDAG